MANGFFPRGILQALLVVPALGTAVLAQNVVLNSSFETGAFVQDASLFVPGSSSGSTGGGTSLPGSGSSGSAPGLPGSGSSSDSGPALPGSGSGSSTPPPPPGSTGSGSTTTVPSQMTLLSGSTAINNWTVGVGGGYVGWIKTPDFNPQSGSYAVVLKSYQAAPFSYVQQSLATTVGKTYEVSGFFSSEGNGGPTMLSVMVNGTVIGSITNGFGAGGLGLGSTNLVWTASAFRFQAASATTTLRFQDATVGSEKSPILDNVSLILVPLPEMTSQPSSQITRVGGRATLSAAATGQGPLTYQWRLNGANVVGGTNSELALTSLTMAQAGTYTVLVSNAFGSATSTGANLSLVELSINSGRPRVNVAGPINARYRVEVADSLSASTAWSPLIDLVLLTSPSSALDSQANLGSQRYFRVTPLP